MATVRATIPVKADVITWARESLGLTKEEAAESLKVSLELLNAWESGRTEPRVGELRRLARVYKRPLSVLLLPERPPTRPIPEDFRTIEGRPPKMLPQTLVAIREAQRIQEIAAELLEYDPTLLIVDVLGRYNIEDSAIDSAAVERANFGVTVETQLRWRTSNEAFNFWRTRLQLRGILTIAEQMPREDCRGFSLKDLGMVLIAVNSREVDQAKNFTLFHEYAHLLLDRHAVCLEQDTNPIERWCNEFAACFLVPERALKALAPPWTDSTQDVEFLARRFRVSRHVIAIRLAEFDLAARELYEQIKAEDNDRDFAKDPLGEDFKGRPQAAVRLTALGIGFARLVIGALDKSLISHTDASDFLSLNTDHFRDLRNRIGSALSNYA